MVFEGSHRMSYATETGKRLSSRLIKEQQLLAAELSAPSYTRLVPRTALADLDKALRVYRQQLDTCARIAEYLEAGSASLDTKTRHDVKRHLKRLRLVRFVHAARRSLMTVKIALESGLEAPPATPELEALVAEAEGVLRSSEVGLDRKLAAQVGPRAEKRRWSPTEDAAVLAGARELPGRSAAAIMTRRHHLNAPKRADDRRKKQQAHREEVFALLESWKTQSTDASA
jgi:hypothetical protein